MFFKKYKNWIIGAVVFLIIYLIIKAIANRSPEMTLPSGGTAGGAVIPARFKYDASKVDRSQVIGSGTKNSHAVAYLQDWLNTYYGEKLAVDGDFGSKTRAAATRAATVAGKPNLAAITFTLDSAGI